MADYKTTEETRELLGLDVMRAEVDVLLRSTNDQVIAKADEARESATTAENARDEATTQASVSNDHRMAAEQARDSAVLASEAAGITKFYDTHAAAEAAKAGLAEGQVVAIFADETRGGSPARYRKEGASLVFKLDLGQFDRLMELDQRKPRKLWAKMYDIANTGKGHVNWVSVGDSLASRKFTQFAHHLDRMLGSDNYTNGNFPGDNPGTPAGDQLYIADAVSATSVTGTYGIVPTGTYTNIAAGGSLRFTYGGYDPSYTKVRVLYIKEPGAGTINLRVNGTTMASANAASATTELGILEHSVGPTTINPGPTTVTVTGATVKMLGGHKVSEDKRGVVKHTLLAQGGITPDQLTQNATVRLIHQQLLAAFTPDMVTLEMDDNFGDGGMSGAALDHIADIWMAAAPYADKLLIGSTPRASGDIGKMLANLRLREVAQQRGASFLYFDSYKIMGSYAEMTAIFGADDGVHPTARAQQFAAEMLWNHLGLNNPNLGFSYRPVRTPGVASSFYHGTEFRAGVTRLALNSDNTFGYDWDMVYNRVLRLKSEAGAVVAQFSHNTAIEKNILPAGFNFGADGKRALSMTTGLTYQNSTVNFTDTDMASGYLTLHAQGLKSKPVTKANLPFAPANTGTIRYCSDGRADGGGCFIYADAGAGWKRLSDDSTVS